MKKIVWFVCSYVLLILIVSIPSTLFINLIGADYTYFEAVLFQVHLKHFPLNIISYILSGVFHMLMLILNFIFVLCQEAFFECLSNKDEETIQS